MKKRNALYALLSLVLVGCMAFGLVGCKDEVAEPVNPPVNYTVAFSLGIYTGAGSAPDAIVKEANGSITLPAVGVTWENHTFLGWLPEGETTPLAAGSSYTVVKSIVLTAQWRDDGTSIPQQYTVSFDLGEYDGDGKAPEAITQAANSTIEHLPPVGVIWSNHSFLGWKNEAGTMYDAGASYTVTKTETLTAQWHDDTPDLPAFDTPAELADLSGVWTGSGVKLTVDVQSSYGGSAILNGKEYFTIYEMEDDGGVVGYADDYVHVYTFNFNEDKTMLQVAFCAINEENEEEVEITEVLETYVFTNKSALVAKEESDFVGKYQKQGTAQKWLLTEGGEAYYSKLNAGTQVYEVQDNAWWDILGEYAILSYGSYYNYYTFILTVGEANALEGYYIEPEKAGVATVLEASNFYMLTVEGELSQFVNAGSKPGTISTPNAPSGKKFSHWVLEGTETEFDPDKEMTADASIEAVFVDDVPDAVSEFVTYTNANGVKVGSILSVTITSITIDVNDVSTTVSYVTTGKSGEADWTEKDSDGYYEIKISNVSMYLLLNEEKTVLTVCNTSYGAVGTLTKEGTSQGGGEQGGGDEPSLDEGAFLGSVEDTTRALSVVFKGILFNETSTKATVLVTIDGKTEKQEDLNLISSLYQIDSKYSGTGYTMTLTNGYSYFLLVLEDGVSLRLYEYEDDRYLGTLTKDGAGGGEGPGPVEPPAGESEWVEFEGEVNVDPNNKYGMGGAIIWMKIDVNGEDLTVTYKIKGSKSEWTAVADASQNSGTYGLYYTLPDFGSRTDMPTFFIKLGEDGYSITLYATDGTEYGKLYVDGHAPDPVDPPEENGQWVEFEGVADPIYVTGGGACVIVWVKIDVSGENTEISFKIQGSSTIYTAVYADSDSATYGKYYKLEGLASRSMFDPYVYFKLSDDGSTLTIYDASSSPADELGTFTKA